MTLVADNVGFSFSKPVLSGLDVRCEPGRVTAILGPNGCGKTTLLRLMLGLLKPHQGSCRLDRTPVFAMPAAERASRLAYVPHRPEVGYGYSVRSFVSFAHVVGPTRAGVVEQSLERLRLTELADRPIASLSAGQAQRASIARALAQLREESGESRFLLADEPTAALDPRHVAEVSQMLRELADDGVGIVVVLHDVAAASHLADDVVLLTAAGSVHASGAASDVLTPNQLKGVFGTPFGVVEQDGRSIPMAFHAPSAIA